MADENVVTNIVATADFSDLIGNVNRLNSQLAQLKQNLTNTDKALALQAAKLQQSFSSTLRSTGQFSTHFVSLSSDVEKFGKNLDAGKLKLRDYYNTWQNHQRTSGGLIRDLAKQQVQLQNAILQPLGRNAEGLMQFNVQIPRGLDAAKNRASLLKQEMQIMNKVIQDGGVQLINWGKNTQWAGRQLTVGLTIPLAAFGKAAADAFRAADEQLVRLTKVYGGVAQTSAVELGKIRKEVAATAKELAQAYGASYTETISLAADIAATGKQGEELLNSTRETTRLAVLGEVDRQEAMKATLAIQTAFNQNTQQLSESINFLNAVENQTSTSLADLIEAIPKAGPVVKSLGGDIQDLALYLTAMKEGGINASEGANAIKSSLASLINPTKVAKEMFAGFGIDLGGIVTSNAGNLTGTILELQKALDSLDPLTKAKAIEQLFGKFQFARLSALFDNLGKQGSQTLEVLDLMNASASDLANVAGRELSQITESASGKYRRAIEGLKADLAGVGDAFLNIQTFFINLIDKVIEFSKKLPDPLKKILTFVGGLTAVAGPLIMLTGVLANFFGYIVKGAAHFRALFKGGEGWKLLTPEILAAQKAGNLMEATFYSDAKAASILQQAISNLNIELDELSRKASAGTISAQPMISTIAGNTLVAGGREVISNHPLISAKDTRSFSHPNPVSGMTAEQKAAQTIFGIVPGAPLVNQKISNNPQMYMSGDLPKVEGFSSIRGASTGIVAEEAARWHAMTGALAMQSKEEIALLKREVAATGLITTSLSDSYQALLPEISRITTLAASESAEIVAELQASKINIDQARAKVIALNRQIETLMGQAATGVATAQGRTINLTQLPIVNQPAFDPVTGKANMKELTRPRNRNFITKIAEALGVKTYGAPYSIETTRPKRLNMGGQVFTTEQGRFVPGQGNTDTVPAMLTPGEFVVTKEQTARDPEGLHLYNKGKAVIVPVQNRNSGGMINDMQYFGRFMPNRIVRNISKSRNKKQTRDRDIIEAVHGIKARGADARGFISQIGDIQDPVLRQKYLDIATDYTNRLTRSKDNPVFYSQTAKTLQSKNISDLNSRFADNGLPVLPYTEPIHATHLTVSKLGNGKTLVSDYMVDYSETSNLQANQNSLRPVDLLRRDLIKTSGVNKYRRQLRAANIPVSKWDEAEDAIDLAIRTRFENEAIKRGVTIDQLPTIGDRPERGAQFTFTKDLIPEIEKVLTSYNPLATLLPSYTSLKENKVSRIQRKNMGGIIQNFGTNMVGRIVKSLSKSKIDKLTAKWKPQMQFRKPGYQYTLGNQDPLHGPLQIGKSMVPKNYQNDPEFTREVLYQDDRFARQAMLPQFLTGNMEERGKYATAQYMSGNLDIMSQMQGLGNHPLGPIAAMKTLQRKFTGKLYRGLRLDKTFKGLPQDLIEAIGIARSTGDASGIIGKEFIMRRSSWSKSPTIASFFAPGSGVDPNNLVIEAAIKNRNILPAGDMFPDKKFLAPYGQDWSGGSKFGGQYKSEQEAIFGGKFRVVGFDKGKLKVETVVDGARAMGGPVNSGRPYLVGENGPEIFVPRNSGGIIPGYQDGGVVGAFTSGLRNPYGKGAISGMAGKQMGMGTQIGIGMAGGMAGQMIGGPAGMAVMMASNIIPMMGAMKGFAGLIPSVAKVASILGRLTIPGAIIGSLVGIVSLINKMKKDATTDALGFGLTADAASKAGLKFTDYNQKIKDSIESAKAMQERNQMLYESMTQSNTPLKMSIEQYKKLREEIKTTMPEYIKLIDRTKTDKVGDVAVQLKAQFIAAGDSAEEATAKIYALIEASNKKGSGFSSITSEQFRSVNTPQQAAMTTADTFAKSMATTNEQAQVSSLLTAFQAIDTAVADSAKKNKEASDKNKAELISIGTIIEDQISKINKGSAGQIRLSAKAIEELRKQNPELAKILNSTDTLTTAWAKYQLQLKGVSLDLSKISGTAAEAALKIANVISSTTQDVTKNDALKTQYEELDRLDNKVKQYQATTKGQSVKDQQTDKAKIKSLNAQINLVNKLADDKIKALRKTQSAENAELEIQQIKLEYQQAIARGDRDSAAQAQMRLQQLVSERQTAAAEENILSNAATATAPLQAEIDAINEKQEKMGDAAALAGDKLGKAAKEADTFRSNLDGLNALLIKINTDRALDPTYRNSPREAADLVALLGAMQSVGAKQLTKTVMPNTKDTTSLSFMKDIASRYTGAENLLGQVASTVSMDAKVVNLYAGSIKQASENKGSFDTATSSSKVYSGSGISVTKSGGTFTASPSDFKKAGLSTMQGVMFTDSDGKRWVVNREFQGKVYVSKMAAGGYISGPGSGTSDSIPAMLSNGEYVISAKSVQAAGLPMLDRINKMGKGGPVYDVPSYSMGGRVKYNAGGMATSSNSLYNINVTLNGSNLNPNDVARAIDNQMRLREAMNGRGRNI